MNWIELNYVVLHIKTKDPSNREVWNHPCAWRSYHDPCSLQYMTIPKGQGHIEIVVQAYNS
jgi:hypothetical protein